MMLMDTVNLQHGRVVPVRADSMPCALVRGFAPKKLPAQPNFATQFPTAQRASVLVSAAYCTITLNET